MSTRLAFRRIRFHRCDLDSLPELIIFNLSPTLELRCFSSPGITVDPLPRSLKKDVHLLGAAFFFGDAGTSTDEHSTSFILSSIRSLVPPDSMATNCNGRYTILKRRSSCRNAFSPSLLSIMHTFVGTHDSFHHESWTGTIRKRGWIQHS